MSEFDPVLLTLPSALAPPLAVEVLPHGFTIHRLLVQVDGKTHDIVIGPEAPEGHVKQKYTNSIVGRYANRIPVGTHQLERNGFKSELTTLSNESPQVSLHGGLDGFDARPWTHLPGGKDATLFTAAEIATLSSIPSQSVAVFRLESPSGDQGFPGTLLTEALIALVDPASAAEESAAERVLGSIVIVYRAKLTDANTVTPVNLTQHWGFNLDASLQDGPDALSIKNHKLTIKASGIAQLDSHALGTGEHISVSQLPAHDHNAKVIGDKFPDKGYDDFYLFREDVISSVPSRIPVGALTDEANYLSELLRPLPHGNETSTRSLVELSSDKSGLKLVFDSNQHGAMFYSNAMANPANGARKKIHGGSGIPGDGAAYGPSTAAFLEFHHPLAAFLYPENKDGEDTLVTSDEIYHNFVRLDVKFKRPQPLA